MLRLPFQARTRDCPKGQEVRLNEREQTEASEPRGDCGSGLKESADSQNGVGAGRSEGGEKGAPSPRQIKSQQGSLRLLSLQALSSGTEVQTLLEVLTPQDSLPRTQYS